MSFIFPKSLYASTDIVCRLVDVKDSPSGEFFGDDKKCHLCQTEEVVDVCGIGMKVKEICPSRYLYMLKSFLNCPKGTFPLDDHTCKRMPPCGVDCVYNKEKDKCVPIRCNSGEELTEEGCVTKNCTLPEGACLYEIRGCSVPTYDF
jgi:hypothetical protein